MEHISYNDIINEVVPNGGTVIAVVAKIAYMILLGTNPHAPQRIGRSIRWHLLASIVKSVFLYEVPNWEESLKATQDMKICKKNPESKHHPSYKHLQDVYDT